MRVRPNAKQRGKKPLRLDERAVAGEDFASLAMELSEGPNAANGGDLGFTARGQMVESFDDAVWALEVGEISEVVESRLGLPRDQGRGNRGRPDHVPRGGAAVGEQSFFASSKRRRRSEPSSPS